MLLLVSSLLLYLKYAMQYLFHNIQGTSYGDIRSRMNNTEILEFAMHI